MSDSAVDIESESHSDGVSRSSSDAEMKAGGGGIGSTVEQMSMRIESLQQENRVLRMELDAVRCKCKGLEEENRELKKSRVDIVSRSRMFLSDLKVKLEGTEVAFRIFL
jgi:coiled-coil domain-containing protein 6